ncbi:BON domain-containing protein [Pararhodospirillum oryzae]|uniref:Transporter n=1 Tax=Pararhodospirillum oryzae TaxID=478448 RepID=A0A512H604_9PROT|nr:BON domain-containing protein [Pararhodospirillum oryzae]GEO80858.1 transporter [Pararhodospirillum oryzae]
MPARAFSPALSVKGRRAVILTLGLGLVLSAGACVPAALVGAGAGTASAASEERGFGGFVDDAAIQTALNGKLFTTNERLFTAVNLTVREGRVLMTGSVATNEDRRTATRLAWEVDGVREVLNELTVNNGEDILDAGRDEILANRLKASMLFDSSVASRNYTVDVVNGVVYVMGVAADTAERERVLGYARALPHVRRVVDYTRLRGQPLPAQGAPRS